MLEIIYFAFLGLTILASIIIPFNKIAEKAEDDSAYEEDQKLFDDDNIYL